MLVFLFLISATKFDISQTNKKGDDVGMKEFFLQIRRDDVGFRNLEI